VANPPNSPCQDDSRDKTAAVAISGISTATVALAKASTDQTPTVLTATAPAVGDQALAKASSSAAQANAGIAPIQLVSMSSQARARCDVVPGSPVLTGSSQVTGLQVLAQRITTSSPRTIVLLGATVYVNRQIVTANEIIQRAVEIDSVFGADVILGESKAGFAGTPIHPTGSPCSA
jgi:hypothetical protein